MSKKITIAMLAGDSGHSMIQSCKRVLSSLLPDAPEFVDLPASFSHYQQHGTSVPQSTIDVLKSGRVDASIFGRVKSPLTGKDKNYVSPVVSIRQILGLYAHMQINDNITICREATECLFIGKEWMKTPDVAVAERVITRRPSREIAHFAMKQALAGAERRSAAMQLESMRRREADPTSSPPAAPNVLRRPSVTLAHKANILPLTDGLMRTVVFDEVAPEYPGVDVNEILVDMCVYKMIRQPDLFDVILCCNTYGDILDDAAAAISGGLGLTPIACSSDSFVFAHGADVVDTSSPTELYDYLNPIGHM